MQYFQALGRRVPAPSERCRTVLATATATATRRHPVRQAAVSPTLDAEQRGVPEWVTVHEKLRKKNVTKFMLWQEYHDLNSFGCNYSWFCDQYWRWLNQRDISMRQHHGDSENYSSTTTVMQFRLLMHVLAKKLRHKYSWRSCLGCIELHVCCSDCPDWTGSHVRAFEFFQAVPEILVTYNLKSGVSKAHRFEPVKASPPESIVIELTH